MTKMSFYRSFVQKKTVNKWVPTHWLLVASANGLLLLNLSQSPVCRPETVPCFTVAGVSDQSIHICVHQRLNKQSYMPQYIKHRGEHG
ncbi:MAG: fatty acid desaturase [Paraglaciecola sp.]|jgi:fatty acid desaturase